MFFFMGNKNLPVNGFKEGISYSVRIKGPFINLSPERERIIRFSKLVFNSFNFLTKGSNGNNQGQNL